MRLEGDEVGGREKGGIRCRRSEVKKKRSGESLLVRKMKGEGRSVGGMHWGEARSCCEGGAETGGGVGDSARGKRQGPGTIVQRGRNA